MAPGNTGVERLVSEIEEAAQLIASHAERARPIVCFTGAGISRESGIPTFRGDAGIWREHDPQEVATLEGFLRDPERAWRFHERLRGMCLTAAPNAAHLALAWIENSLGHETPTPIITQNIDGLHQAAGSTDVIEIHGSCHRVRCVECSYIDDDLPAEFKELPPMCECGEMLRPDVVWFGERLPRTEFREAEEWAQQAGVMLIIGTSATVQPAASLPALALHSGAVLIEVNPMTTAVSEVAEIVLRGPAGLIVPELAEALGQLRNGEIPREE